MRIARLLDRMAPSELSEVLPELQALELRRAAGVLLSAERVAWTVGELSPQAVHALVLAATDDDAVRAILVLPSGRGARVLLGLPDPRRDQVLARVGEVDPKLRRKLARHLPRPRKDAEALRPVLRLRRLFA
jgi:Mg/Co/Ni transporter MgtE